MLTVTQVRQIDKRAGEYMNTWGRILEEQVRAHQKDSYGGIDGSAVKRGLDDDDDDDDGGGKEVKPKKKAKTEESNLSSLSTNELKKLIAKGSLSKHTVVELKDLLFSKGISASGKKQDLIDAVEQWVEGN